jgi:hypothetical protein
MSIKIRAYTTEDLFTVVDMLSAITGAASEELQDMFVIGSGAEKSKLTEAEQDLQEKKNGVRIIMFVLNKCYKEVRPLLVKWFASLCEVAEKDFLLMAPSTVLEIIKHLATAKESKDFFTDACQLYKEINGSIGDTASN